MFFRQTFALINARLRRLEVTNAELTTKLNDLTTEVGKIGTETAASLKMITDLQAQIAGLDNVPQSVVDAVNALAAQIQKTDDLVPDAPPAP